MLGLKKTCPNCGAPITGSAYALMNTSGRERCSDCKAEYQWRADKRLHLAIILAVVGILPVGWLAFTGRVAEMVVLWVFFVTSCAILAVASMRPTLVKDDAL